MNRIVPVIVVIGAGAVPSTGKAVLLTTLTTLMAFGTISFSSHKGLAQLGMITCIGLSIALLTSLFVIPILIRLTSSRVAGSTS